MSVAYFGGRRGDPVDDDDDDDDEESSVVDDTSLADPKKLRRELVAIVEDVKGPQKINEFTGSTRARSAGEERRALRADVSLVKKNANHKIAEINMDFNNLQDARHLAEEKLKENVASGEVTQKNALEIDRDITAAYVASEHALVALRAKVETDLKNQLRTVTRHG
jgi:hypothetical protein